MKDFSAQTTAPHLQPAQLLAAVGGALNLAVAMGIGRYAFTPALALMQRDVGLGDAGAGLLASFNYIGYLAGAVLAAHVPWRSRRPLFLCFLAVSVLTTGLMAAGSSFGFWLVLRTVSGLASAFLFVLGSGMALDALPSDGHGAGILFCGVGCGIAVTGVLTPLGDGLGGWSAAWLVCAAAAVILALPAAAFLRVPARSAGTVAPGPADIRVPFRSLLVSYFCAGLGYIITGTFLVVIVQRMPGAPAGGDFTWTLLGLTAVPSCPLWAAAGKRFGQERALIAAFLLHALGIALPVLSDGPAATFGGAALYGGTFMGIVLLTMALGKKALPGATGKAVGWLTVVYGIGQILGPWLAGVVAERSGSFDLPLLGGAGIILVGAAPIALALTKKTRHSEQTAKTTG